MVFMNVLISGISVFGKRDRFMICLKVRCIREGRIERD